MGRVEEKTAESGKSGEGFILLWDFNSAPMQYEA